MGLSAVEYRDVSGRGVVAQGGLKFRASEQSLSRYFAPILPFVTLNDLIGEAAFWILMPSTIAVWTLPLLLYLTGLPWALTWTIGLYLLAHIIHQLVYFKSLNYIVFMLGNRILQFVVYLFLAIVFANTNHLDWTITLAAMFLCIALGLDVIFVSPLTLVLNRFVGLPTSDQLLRLIGWHYARKYTEDDPTKWKMFDEKGQES